MFTLQIAVALALSLLLACNSRAMRRVGGNLVKRWSGTKGAEARKSDEQIDEASTQSFPASDPPSFSAVHAGPPSRRDDQ
jgi:hypothetical protein